MKCEICGTPATVHICELDEAGGTCNRSLCAAHAQEHLNFPVPSEAEFAQGHLATTRRLIAFIKSHDRMPTAEEMKQLNCSGDLSTISRGSPEYDKQLQYLERLADFIEREGRLPTKDELPDAF